MDPRSGKKTTSKKQTRSHPNRPVYPPPQQTTYPNPFSQQFSQQFSTSFPNQFSQPSTPYIPQPASPHPYFPYNVGANPPPMNAQHYNINTTSEWSPWDEPQAEVVPETQPLPDTDEEDEDDDIQEVDVRGKKKATTKAKREHWTPDQEVALAKAWIQISECKRFGNEQNRKDFWKRVLEHYATTMGGTTRTIHGLTTKWKAMNQAMGIFNGAYIQADRVRASGCSEVDVMKVALKDYNTRTKGKDFGHIPAWEIVKDHNKWKEQECFQDIPGMGCVASGSSKRKSGEYESGSNDNFIPDMNEDPSPPIESRKAKKKQAASSSSVHDVGEDISTYAKRKTKYLDIKEEKDQLAASFSATQLDATKSKVRQRDLKFYTDPHNHITDPAMLELLLEEKRQVAAKWGWPCNF